MKRRLLLLATLLAAAGKAGTLYVSDDLVLGVYAARDAGSPRLATLHSGAAVETLDTEGEYTQVRLGDGKIGWVKSSFLVARAPAAARLKDLEDELSRVRATPAGLAAAAAQSEVARLRGELDAKQLQLQAALDAGRAPGSVARADAAPMQPAKQPQQQMARMLTAGGAALVLLMAGFGVGYYTLAQRLRRKFGGIKVY